MSESTVRRVLAGEGLIIEGPPPRKPAPRSPWPDWLEWKPNRIWAYDFERHEAPWNRVEVKDRRRRAVAAAPV